MGIQSTVSNGQTLDYNRFLSKGYNFLGSTWHKHQIRILKYRLSDGPYVVFLLYIFGLEYKHAGHWLLKIYHPNFYFMFCSLQGQNQGLYLKEKWPLYNICVVSPYGSPSSETQGLQAGTMQYFWAKVYFKSWRAPGNLFLPNQF